MREAERALIEVSAAIGAGSARALEAALEAAARAATPQEVEETLLQSYLFAGYPAALRAFAFWRERQRVGEAAGAADKEGTEVGGVHETEKWGERGERVCREVYGSQYEQLRENVRVLHPELERWMIEDGYGKVLGRRGLELRVRELCIVSLLAGQDAADPLYSHLRGALNVGASPAEVELALAASAAVAAPARSDAARSVWRSVLERRAAQSATG